MSLISTRVILTPHGSVGGIGALVRDAEARERAAAAEAEATRVVSEAIATSGTQALNYFVAQKYTEAVAAFASSPNAKTILFPVEATQLIGSVGGIGALVRDALSSETQPPQPPRQPRSAVPPSLPRSE